MNRPYLLSPTARTAFRVRHSQAAAELEAGRSGQDGVEEDEVRLYLLGEIESLHASIGREHLEAVVGQLLLEVGPHRAFVLNQENRSPEHGG